MNKLIKYLPTHFLIGLIIGILLQSKFAIWSFGTINLFILFAVLILILLIFYFIKNKLIFTLWLFPIFIFIGIAVIHIQDDRNYYNYYKNVANKDNCSVILRITKVLKENNYYYNYEANVLQVDKTKSIGKILLSIKKDSLPLSSLNTDDIIFTKTSFKTPKTPLNPHQFNYKDYLAKKGIYHQLKVESYQVKTIGKYQFSPIGFATKTKNYLQNKLQKYYSKSEEFAIINALLLGQRQDISKTLLNSYVDAGAVHILAISGLHIGIIAFALLWLFTPLKKLKKGKYLPSLFTVILLWVFAFITGLSASTVRAVTMFTFVVVGYSLQQKQFVEHSLATSMLILLIINPLFLFDIGFQLSYLAVLGIVWTQPIFYKLIKPTTKITDYFWKIFTVSLSAQIGILPLSLFYFHQFPSLFFLSNLVIIPLLEGVLMGGIIVITLATINLLPSFISTLYEKIIYLMNSFIKWISYQESFIFKGISISFTAMCSWYIVLIFCYLFLNKKKPKQLIYFLITIILLQSVYIFEKYEKEQKEAFLIFHKNKKSIFGNRQGNQILFFHNLDSTEIYQQKIIQNYIVKEDVNPKFSNENHSIFKFGNHTILCIDSLGVYELKKLKKGIVILKNSPKINLNRLIAFLQPQQIIADGTNYISYIKHWEKTCNQQNIPFHYTGKKGFFQITNTKKLP